MGAISRVRCGLLINITDWPTGPFTTSPAEAATGCRCTSGANNKSLLHLYWRSCSFVLLFKVPSLVLGAQIYSYSHSYSYSTRLATVCFTLCSSRGGFCATSHNWPTPVCVQMNHLFAFALSSRGFFGQPSKNIKSGQENDH